jgi:hypothetical protein
LSAHKTIEAGNENRLFTMDYIARLDFKLLFCVHSSKFGKCLFSSLCPAKQFYPNLTKTKSICPSAQGLNFNAVYYSNLKNAVETAKIAVDSCYVLPQFLTPLPSIDFREMLHTHTHMHTNETINSCQG